jgi:hypothetical protein
LGGGVRHKVCESQTVVGLRSGKTVNRKTREQAGLFTIQD